MALDGFAPTGFQRSAFQMGGGPAPTGQRTVSLQELLGVDPHGRRQMQKSLAARARREREVAEWIAVFLADED